MVHHRLSYRSTLFSVAALTALLALAGTPLWARGPAPDPAPDPAALALIAELDLREAPVAARDLPGWQRPQRVVVTRANADVLRVLQAAAPGVELLAAADAGNLAEQLARAQAVIGLCDSETLAAAPALHWIQTWWVGVEDCVAVPGLLERGIVLTNMQRTSAIPIAEHAVAMMMALARGLPAYGRLQQSATWQTVEGRPVRELTGSTVLVVGLGGIGTEVARRAHGLGMRVIATRNSRREGPDFVAQVGLPDELHELAAQADFIVNTVPLTAQTTAIFNAEFFAAARKGAYFVNIARGQSVVTDDLLAALHSGQLAGAGLDVTDPEPLPSTHPLWAMENVIITPHVAADSISQRQRYVLLVAENLRRYVAGEPLLNVVDIQRGY